MKEQFNLEGIPCTIRIKSVYPSLRNSEKKVADYLLTNDYFINKSIEELKQEVGVSTASIIRLCKKLGYSGFVELKLMIAQESGERNGNDRNDHFSIKLSRNDKLADVPSKIIYTTIQALEDSMKIFREDEYIKAINAISGARKIDIYGVANSFSIADDAMNKFIRLGKVCNVYSDAHLQITSATNLGKNDVAIGISHSGKTISTINALKQAKKSGATIICITNYTASLMNEIADIKLLTASYESDFSSEPMVSRISQLAIIDMLFIGLIVNDYDFYTNKLSSINDALSDLAYDR